VTQAGLGIATLLTEVAIPLAALHQAGALVLFTLALWFGHVRQRAS
jgi:cytochrome c oxidase assembly protein subunit 15